MAYPIDQQELRRSQRTSQSVPLLVSLLDSPSPNVDNLKTIVVSHHGCVIMALHPFPRVTDCALITFKAIVR